MSTRAKSWATFSRSSKNAVKSTKRWSHMSATAFQIPRSWLFAAGTLDFELRIASHKKYQPEKKLLERAGGRVTCTDDVAAAARDADVLYTDIWVSMGKEAEEARREAELGPYWITESVVKLAKPDALVMHCLPAHRGQEIDEQTFEAHAQTIFDQA